MKPFTTVCIRNKSIIIKQFRGPPRRIWKWNRKCYSKLSSVFWKQRQKARKLFHFFLVTNSYWILLQTFSQMVIPTLWELRQIIPKVNFWGTGSGRSIMHLPKCYPSSAGHKFFTDSNQWWRSQEVPVLNSLTVHPNWDWVTFTS